MSYAQQRYFAATAIAIMAAIMLRAAQLPTPWPAAIAVYVYGVVAWPAVREEIFPDVRPGLYTAMCLAAALLVIVYENLGAAAGW